MVAFARSPRHLLAVAALAGAVVLVPAAGPAQAVATCTQGALDVNGDGYDDSVIGVPGEDVGSAVDAGAVNVLLGGSNLKPYGNGEIQITESTLGGTDEAGDRFGAALAVGDFDGDGCIDVAIGAPGEDDGAGQVAIALLSGAPASGTTTTWVGQAGTGPDDVPEAGDQFGSALSAMWDHGVPLNVLWVGAPGEDVGAAADAGAITRIGDFAFPDDPITDHVRTLHQGDGELSGSAEAGDRLGASLAAGGDWAAAGAPGEDVGHVTDAGLVNQVGRSPQTLTQNSPGVPGGVETGDQFGATLAATWDCDNSDGALVVGAPLEDVGTSKDAGTVTVASFGTKGGSPWMTAYAVTQDSPGVPGAVEAGDRFGAAVIGDWSGVAIGAPGEDIGTVRDAGNVTDLWQWCEDQGTGIPVKNQPGPGQAFAQSTAGVPGSDETGDAFGSTLAVLYWKDGAAVYQSAVLVGAPREDVGTTSDAGGVTVLPYVRSTSLLTTKGSLAINEGTYGDSAAVEVGDQFAGALDATS